MNYLFIFLKNIVIICLLLSQFSSNIFAYSTCTEDDENDEGLEAVLSLMPGQKKCLEYTSNGEIYSYFKDLKEFKINKNNKYCLWSSKNWDDECQNISMEYAYGDYGRSKEKAKEFKKVIISFIKHIQNNEINEALKLTSMDAMFFTNENENCLVEKPDYFPGCRSYFNKLHKDKGRYDDFNMEIFRQNLMQIDVDHFKFFLSDLGKMMVYEVIIPYEYKNIKKEFYITFDFYRSGHGYWSYSSEIYNLGIYTISGI